MNPIQSFHQDRTSEGTFGNHTLKGKLDETAAVFPPRLLVLFCLLILMESLYGESRFSIAEAFSSAWLGEADHAQQSILHTLAK
jgi:hypothetical protein